MARTLKSQLFWYKITSELVKDGDVWLFSGSLVSGDQPYWRQSSRVQSSWWSLCTKKAEWASLKMRKQWLLMENTWIIANIGTPKDVEGVNDNGRSCWSHRTDSCTWILRLPNWRWSMSFLQSSSWGMNGKPVVVRLWISVIKNSLTLIFLKKWPILGFHALRISISETGNQCSYTIACLACICSR